MSESTTNIRLSEMELRRIINRCRRGERAAFDALVRAYEKRIFSMSYQLCGQYDEANDILADTILRLFRAISGFRGDAHFDSWLRRIVFNVFLDRRKCDCSRRQVSLTGYGNGDELGTERYLIDPAPTPHRIAEENERRTILRRAVALLPADQREAVVLYHDNGDSYAEIALALAVPVGTVKSRLNRARGRLRERLLPFRGSLTGSGDMAGNPDVFAAFPDAASLAV